MRYDGHERAEEHVAACRRRDRGAVRRHPRSDRRQGKGLRQRPRCPGVLRQGPGHVLPDLPQVELLPGVGERSGRRDAAPQGRDAGARLEDRRVRARHQPEQEPHPGGGQRRAEDRRPHHPDEEEEPAQAEPHGRLRLLPGSRGAEGGALLGISGRAA
ncbi:hypothetical protein SGPA1_12316 [Streptomyces misionensis JCM 4497]